MRIVILAPQKLNESKLEYFKHIFLSSKIEVLGAVILNPIKEKPLLKLRRKIKRDGLLMSLRRFIYNKIETKFHNSMKRSAKLYFEEKSIPIVVTKEKYSKNVIEFISSKKPDALFRTGWGIIKEPLLSITPVGIVSYHHGDIRKYRGMPPCFWQLYNNESSMKVTIQILKEGLDCGKIVAEKDVQIRERDDLKTLHRRVYAVTYSMASVALEMLDDPHFKPVEIKKSNLGTLYTTPKISQLFMLYLKIYIKNIKPSRKN